MNAKDDEVRAVVTELDALLNQLQANVDALSTALNTPPAKDGPGKEVPVP